VFERLALDRNPIGQPQDWIVFDIASRELWDDRSHVVALFLEHRLRQELPTESVALHPVLFGDEGLHELGRLRTAFAIDLAEKRCPLLLQQSTL
jgi:hypothetical protein